MAPFYRAAAGRLYRRWSWPRPGRRFGAPRAPTSRSCAGWSTQRCTCHPGRPLFPESVLDEPDVSHYYRGFGAHPGDVGRVAASGAGACSGAAWVRQFTADDPGYGYVDDDTPELTIAVTVPHRGAGLGSALLADLLLEVPRCSLSVDARNPARRLYARFGFAPVSEASGSITMLRRASTPGAHAAAATATTRRGPVRSPQ